jgi:DNA-binding transcriptional LysR family regulator
MILRHLRYFSAVCERGSMVRGAVALRVAQPALSRQLRALEQAVGVPLLERVRHGVRPTRAGDALLAIAPAIFERLETAVFRARLAYQGRAGSLRLGLGRAAAGDPRVGDAISVLRGCLPGVELLVNDLGSLDQAAAVRDGRLDLGIGLATHEPNKCVASVPLFDDVVSCVMLDAAHRFAGEPEIDVRDLRDEQLYMLPALSGRNDSAIKRAMRERGITQWVDAESVEEVFGLIAAGRGWSVTPPALALSAPNGIVVKPTTDLRVPIALALRWRDDDERMATRNAVAILRGLPLPTCPSPSHAPLGAASTYIEFRHLHAVVAARHEGSLARAAHRTALSLSGIGRRIRAVERVIGYPLFTRTGSTLVPTAAGEMFCAEAEGVLELASDAVRQTRRSHRGITHVCRIGCLPEVVDDLLGSAIRDLARRHPEYAVELHEVSSGGQVEALLSGSIDVAVGVMPLDTDRPGAITSMLVMNNPFECALVSPEHRLARRSSITVEELTDTTFLFIDRTANPQMFDLVAKPFAARGIRPACSPVISGVRALWLVVADSDAWTVGLRSMIGRPPNGLTAVPIDGVSIPAEVRAQWRARDQNPVVPAMLAAIAMLKERWAGDPLAIGDS